MKKPSLREIRVVKLIAQHRDGTHELFYSVQFYAKLGETNMLDHKLCVDSSEGVVDILVQILQAITEHEFIKYVGSELGLNDIVYFRKDYWDYINA